MKRVVGFLLLFIIIIVILLPLLKSQFSSNYHYVQFSNYTELQEYLSYAPDKSPLIGAHRGGPLPGYPENAIETFQNSLKFAPCLIECDVRKTKDGKLVMMHDATLDRTTNSTGKVSDFTLTKLKQFRLKDIDGEVTGYRIPTFTEALRWAVGKAILEVDVKEGIEAKEILHEIEKNKAISYVVVITYNLQQLQKYASLHSHLMISASAHTVDGVSRILTAEVEPRRLLVFVGVTEPAPDVYKLLHINGIRAIFGTMHNIDNAAMKRGTKVYKSVLHKGADILATDNVPLAARAVREYILEKKLHNSQ